jgi:hypothetical protein
MIMALGCCSAECREDEVNKLINQRKERTMKTADTTKRIYEYK